MKNWEPITYHVSGGAPGNLQGVDRTRTVGVWTRIGHREDACACKPEFGVYFVFAGRDANGNVCGNERGANVEREIRDIQSLPVYTRPTTTRPRRIAALNHKVLEAYAHQHPHKRREFGKRQSRRTAMIRWNITLL